MRGRFGQIRRLWYAKSKKVKTIPHNIIARKAYVIMRYCINIHKRINRILDKAIFSVQTFGKDLILTLGESYKIEISAYTLERKREYFRI